MDDTVGHWLDAWRSPLLDLSLYEHGARRRRIAVVVSIGQFIRGRTGYGMKHEATPNDFRTEGGSPFRLQEPVSGTSIRIRDRLMHRHSDRGCT